MDGPRRWRVWPDGEAVIGDEVVPVVSRQAMVEAIMDGESFLARSGGVLTVMVGRKRTAFEGEAVTTGAVVEWKPSARAVQPDPEPESDVLPQTEPPENDRVVDGQTGEEFHVEAVEQPSAEPDGFDTSRLEEEDVSALEGAR